MRKVILYIATSLDGYIAGPNHELDWLPPNDGPDDYGYKEMLDSIDTTVMGNNTYKLVLSLGEFPYTDKKNYVFSRNASLQDNNDARFISQDPAAFLQELKQQPGKDIWLIGGSQLNTLFLDAGLIDEFIITAFPVVLGKGIPLFAGEAKRALLKTISVQRHDSGAVQWVLEKSE